MGNGFHAYGAVADDCNDIVQPGFHSKIIEEKTLHGPGIFGYIFVLSYGASSVAISDRNITQIVFGYNTRKIAIRYRYAGIWKEWNIYGKTLSYQDGERLSDITIPASGYFSISVPSGINCVFVTIRTWGSNTGAFSIAGEGASRIYVMGNPGTVITGLVLRFWKYD